MRRARTTGTRALSGAVAAAFLIAAGCASGDDPPPEVTRPWDRTEVWSHPDVVAYDNVAATSSPGLLAWFTRTSGDGPSLAYWELRDGGEAVETALPSPDEQVLIPVAVACDGAAWAAVGVTRDEAQGANTGLMAWTGRSAGGGEAAPGQPLPPPPRLVDAPTSVGAAVLDGGVVVVALSDGQLAQWSRSGHTDEGTNRAWTATRPVLGLDGDLVNVKVAADGERLVLGGVDEDGEAHLWTSPDGRAWEPVSGADLPRDVGSVDLLVPLAEGEMAVGWLDAEESVPFNATAATVQVLDGDELTDQGRIAADGEGDDEGEDSGALHRVDLAGATRSAEGRLVVVGAGLRASGAAAPVVWARDGDGWVTTGGSELTARLDYELRAVATMPDDAMLGLVSGLTHIDVEAWRWD